MSLRFARLTRIPKKGLVLVVGFVLAASVSMVVASYGSASSPKQQPGYWLATPSGAVAGFGDAGKFGGLSNRVSTSVVGIAPTPDAGGYWLAASNGGVFPFGDAKTFGSMAGKHLQRPIEGIAATPDGRGYWLIAADGGVFAFGDAKYFGSGASRHLPSPVVGMAVAPGGAGYWLVTKRGAVLPYGNVPFNQPDTTTPLGSSVVGIASTADGKGYWIVTNNGKVLAFGDARNYGSVSTPQLGNGIVAIAPTPDGKGYWLASGSGSVLAFGDAQSIASGSSQLLARGRETSGHDSDSIVGIAVSYNYFHRHKHGAPTTTTTTGVSTSGSTTSTTGGSGSGTTTSTTTKPTTTTTSSSSSTTRATTTTTRATTTTTHPTTTTTMPTTTTTSVSGGNCTNPSSVVPLDPSNVQSGVQEGNYYVTNDTWNASGYSVAQTLYVCNYNSWYVIANMNNNSGDGAVKTSPNVQETWYPTPTPINSYSSITSSFDDVPPSNGLSSDIYEFEYDIWLGSLGPSSGSTEVMIWTWDHNQTPGGSEIGTFTDGGVTYDVWRSAPPQQYVAFEAVGSGQKLSGSVNISDFFNYMVSQGWISSSAEMYQVDNGMELVSTSGQNEQFSINNFSLNLTSAGGATGGASTTTTQPTTTTTTASTTSTTHPTTTTTHATTTTTHATTTTTHATTTTTSGTTSTSAVATGGSAPTSPPVTWCESGYSDPYTSAPSGAVTVPAGDNSALFSSQLPSNTTYWFATGTHTIGSGSYSQIQPGDGDTFIGAPGAIISGQNQNSYAFEGTYNDTSNENVTIEYLTIENFVPNQGSGSVNGNGNNGWTEEYNVIQDNSPGAGLMLGGNNLVKDNCMTKNGEYGFQGYSYVDETYEDTFTGGATNITFTGNEVSYNNTQGTSSGIEGGGKFWNNGDVTVTGNYVHNNYDSPGLWMDTNNAGFLVQGNYFSNNGSEGLMYEISYNADITDNTFVDNANVTGPTNPGFPDSAIYISESGGNSSVPSTYAGELDITNNVFDDNWGGVVLWQNPNRYAGDGQDPGPLVPPPGEDIGTWIHNAASVCPSNLSETSPIDYHDLCHWYTQNVLVANNTFSFNPSDIGSDCTQANGCGFNALFSAVSSTAAYPGWTIINAVSNLQNNVFKDNTYSGPWSFMYANQGDIATFAQWQAGTTNVESSGYNFGAQDAGSTYTS